MKNYYFNFSKKVTSDDFSYIRNGYVTNIKDAIKLLFRGYKINIKKKSKIYFSKNSTKL